MTVTTLPIVAAGVDQPTNTNINAGYAAGSSAPNPANASKSGYDVFGNPIKTDLSIPLGGGYGQIGSQTTNPQDNTAKPQTAFSSDQGAAQAAENNQKMQTLKNTGLTLGPDGLARFSDSSFATAPSDSTQNEDGTWQSGGVRYAIGPSTTMDPELKAMNDQITQMKTQFDTTSRAVIDNIKAQFDNLIKQQGDINTRSQASLDQSLIMGGSQRYAQESSNGQATALMSYGLQQIGDLNTKEQTAVLQAQQAMDSGDMKLMDTSLNLAQKTRDEKQAAAQTLSTKLAAQADALKVKKQQNAVDTAVGTQLSNGVTDPASIVAALAAQGITATAKDVADSIANLNPNAKEVAQVMADASKYGAPKDVLAAIGKAKNLTEAYQAANGYTNDPTSNAGMYAAYVRQATAAGQTPISPEAFIARTKYNEAYATSKGTEEGKAAGTPPGGGSDISSLPADKVNALTANGFTKYNTSTQGLAAQLVNGQIAPTELSKRTTGSSSYNDILTAADKYSMAVNGKHYNISQADRDYKFATNVQTQNTLNYLGSLVGSDNGSGLAGGNLDQLISLSNARIKPTDKMSITGREAYNAGQGLPALNDATQWAKIQTGDPQMAAYYGTLLEVSDQVAKVLQGGGSGATSDAKLAQAQSLFQKGFTPDQVSAVATQLKELLASRAANMVKDNPYLSDYANQFGVKTDNGVVTTNQKIIQEESMAEGKITSFYGKSPENQKLIDDIHAQFPNISAQEVAQQLGL